MLKRLIKHAIEMYGYKLQKIEERERYSRIVINVPNDFDSLEDFEVFAHNKWYWGFKTVSMWRELFVQKRVRLTNWTHFCDFGAHVGLFSFIAGKQGLSGIAIEASADNIPLLTSNLDGLPVRVIHSAVVPESHDRSPVSFLAGSRSTNGVVSLSAESSSQVTSVSVVDVIRMLELEGGSNLLIKMDVEGSEWAIFEHLSSIIDSAPRCSFLIEVHERSKGEAEDFVADLQAFGYDVSCISRGSTTDLLAIKQ